MTSLSEKIPGYIQYATQLRRVSFMVAPRYPSQFARRWRRIVQGREKHIVVNSLQNSALAAVLDTLGLIVLNRRHEVSTPNAGRVPTYSRSLICPGDGARSDKNMVSRFNVRSCVTGISAALVLQFLSPTPAQASSCPAGTVFNPITKVRWNCIFPITIGGVRVGSTDKLSRELDAQSSSKPLCACRKGAAFWFGVKVSFWSPNRMIDVVTEPGCMMALGADLMPTHGRLQGSQSSIADGTNTRKMFAQMHYYISPVWKMLDMFTDLPCLEDDGFDVAMITEVLPTWQSGTLGAIIQPEGILFGNPAAGLACMADSAAAAAGKVIDPLFWCMGSWGATYPVAGDIHFDDSVEAWAGLAARGTFMMGRLGALTISSADGCSFIPQPIWTKSRYKYQLMEPVKGGSCVNVGRPGALWSSAKHAPGQDNAQFMLFEKVICCAGVSTP